MKLALVLLLYIGVEVSFGTFTIAYLADQQYGDLGLVFATQIIALYWVLMFVGRVLFAKFGNTVNKHYLFSLSCVISALIRSVSVYQKYVWIGYFMLVVGLCNSVLYPCL